MQNLRVYLEEGANSSASRQQRRCWGSLESAMLVNPSVARFQHYAHETVAQIQESLRTFQRVVGLSRRSRFISLVEAIRQRVDLLLSQGKPLWRAFRQRTGETLSGQSHLRLLVTRARDGVYATRLQSEPFLRRIRHLYATSSTRKIVPSMTVATVVGLALIILMLLEMGMSDQAGNEHAGTVKEATPSLTQVPDWTIFDDAFAIQPTSPLASKFADRVRTSGATAMSDRADTSGQMMREPVPLPRPRPRLRSRKADF